MRRLRKHIHGLNLLCPVAQPCQYLYIPGQGGRVAGYIDNTAGLHLGEGFEDCFGATCPGGVCHYYVRPDAFAIETGHDFRGIAYYEFGILYIVVTGVLDGILDGGLHNLNTIDLAGLPGQEQGDGACAAVGVNDNLPARKLGEFQRLAVEQFRLAGIDLKKGARRYMEVQNPQAIPDGGLAPQ